MPGSVDLNTNKGIALVLLSAGIVGGGASALQNQVFGPGGEWQKVVTNQAVIQEQIKQQRADFAALNNTLETGFSQVASAANRQNESLSNIQSQLAKYGYEIEALKVRMKSLEDERQSLLKMQSGSNERP